MYSYNPPNLRHPLRPYRQTVALHRAWAHHAPYRVQHQHIGHEGWSEVFRDVLLRGRRLCDVPRGGQLVSCLHPALRIFI